jgi:hypothetical protein
LTFYGIIKMGVYTKDTRQFAFEYLNLLFENNKTVRVEEFKEKRTLSQNSGYWVWMTYLWQLTGYDKNVWHIFFLNLYPIYKEITIMNRIELVTIGTSEADIQQMSQHMNSIKLHCEDPEKELKKAYPFIEMPDLKAKKTLEMYNYYREKGLI